MLLSLIVGISLAAETSSTDLCPRQPEPTPLASASFAIPASGETLLFSAAPSFDDVRYALRIVRPASEGPASASLFRLKRRHDCNVHDRTGEWNFELPANETDAVFRAASELERLGQPKEIVLDGTMVELQRYSSGRKQFAYSSNGRATDHLSRVVLHVVKRHIPPREVPPAADWH